MSRQRAGIALGSLLASIGLCASMGTASATEVAQAAEVVALSSSVTPRQQKQVWNYIKKNNPSAQKYLTRKQAITNAKSTCQGMGFIGYSKLWVMADDSLAALVKKGEMSRSEAAQAKQAMLTTDDAATKFICPEFRAQYDAYVKK